MKKKNYKEELLWAIIIILFLFIAALDFMWFKTNPIVKVEELGTLKASSNTITLDKNGGSGGTDSISYHGSVGSCTLWIGSRQIVSNYGQSGTTVTPPSRGGYTFLGYYYGDVQIITGNGLLSSDATQQWLAELMGSKVLTAKWSENTYTVTLDYNDGTGKKETFSMKTSMTYAFAYSGASTFPTPTRAGYRFMGWFYNGGAIVPNTKKICVYDNHTLTAMWAGNYHTLYFNYNGADGNNSTSSKSIMYGSAYGDLPNPTRSGHSFNGWYYGNSPINSSTIVSTDADHTVTASWSAWQHTVHYDANGGSGAPGNSTKTYGWPINLSTQVPTRTGYTFVNWRDDSGNTYSSGGYYGADQNGGTVTLHAQWTPNIYTYSLDKQNGSGGSSVIYCKYENAYFKDSSCTDMISANNPISVPSRTGYTFKGYYTGTSGTGSQVIDSMGRLGSGAAHWASNKTFYAFWVANNYSVEYYANKPSGASSSVTGSMNTQSFTYDTSKSLTTNAYILPGYTFSKWNTKADGTGTSYTNGQIVKNLTSTSGGTVNLYAKWTANTYKVTFNKNNATEFEGDESKTVTFDKAYGNLPSVKREYNVVFGTNGGVDCLPKTSKYTFLGWYNGNTKVNTTTNVTTPNNHTLTAKWSETAIELPDTIKEGYTFDGWYTKDGKKVGNAGDKYIPTEDTTLFAHYRGNQYSLTVNPNGGTWKGSTNSQTVKGNTGETIVLEEPVGPTGNYTVTFVKNNGANNDTITQTKKFLGWEIKTAGTINGNSFTFGPGNAEITAKYADSYSVTLPQEQKDGYTLEGWYSDSNLENKVGNAGDSYIATSNTTLYAKWTANTYKLTYDYKEATGGKTENSKQVTYGQNYGTLPTPSRSYLITFNTNGGSACSSKTATWNFAGWYNGSTKITESTKVEIADNHTIEAKWENGTITLPTPTRAGYVFEGWYTDSTLKNVVGNSTQYTKVTTLYAKWVANEYTVVYNSNKPEGATSEVTGSTANSSHTYDVAKVLQINGYELKGYTFAGWNTQPDGKGTNYANGESVKNLTTATEGTVTLYAKWTAHTYIVKYNSNKPSSSNSNVEGSTADSSHTYNEEKVLTTNGYTLKGWTFAGWNTMANGNGVQYANGAKVNNLTANSGENIILYAQWSPNKYNVTYDKNNATIFEGDTNKQVTYDNEYGELPKVKREYTVVFNVAGGTDCSDLTTQYTFLGWYLDSKNIISSTHVLTDKDHVLTAKWTETNITLPETTKKGYTFIGWYNESGEKVGNAGEKYTPNKNTTLYAHYTANEYTVTINPNGGTWKGETKTQSIVGKNEETISLEKPNSPNGYSVVFVKNNGTEDETIIQTRTFLGWEVKFAGSIHENQFTFGAGNSELTAQYSSNDEITLPVVEKQGYTFAGWYSDVTLKTKVGNAGDRYIPKVNTMLYAKWNPNTNTEYKVEYYTEKLDGSYELNNTVSLTGTTESLISAEVKEISGFEFNKNNNSNIQQENIKADGSLVLKLYYSRKSYTITFDVNNGDQLAQNTKVIKYEDKYGDLPEVTREGYTFDGWFDSEIDGNLINTTTKMDRTENHTIYAHWTINEYTLNIYPNGGEYNGYAQSTSYKQNYNSTKVIENPTKNKTGYKVTFVNIGGDAVAPITQTTTFDSWSLSGSGKIETINGKNVFTYGSGETTITANYVGNAITLPTATKEGHTFKGWYNYDDMRVGIEGDLYTPTSDITLYAIYTDEYWDLTINPNGGTWKGSTQVQAILGKYGSSKIIADPQAPELNTVTLHVNDGTTDTKKIIQTSTFEGWENNNGYGTLNGKTYKFGSGEDTITATYKENEVELPTIERTGYTFNGWYTDRSCNNKFGDGGYKYYPTQNMDLYAKWTPKVYTVTFNVNNGEILENNKKQVTYNEHYGELPIPKRAGYTFTGWFDPVSNEITQSSIVDLTEDIVLTARWTESELTVTFDVYKGQVTPQTKQVIYKQEYGTLPVPTMEGCIFEGWYESKEELANKITETTIVRKTEDHTIYAKWKDIQGPKFTYDENNVYTIEVHSQIPELKVQATDNYDDDVEITVTNNIQKDIVGTYEYTITATDKAGNTTTEKKQFNVVDTTKPIINVKDDVNKYEMEVHTVKPAFLATATDNYDEHVDVVVTDDINVDVVGTYTVTFTSTDTNGNVATETRNFKVKDTTPPVITPDENNVYEIRAFEEIPEFKATVIDNYDNDVTVKITNNIDNTNVGTYTVTFTATDKAGNEAKETREFKVIKAIPTYQIPTGIEARYIDTLADVKLPEGFTFEDDLSTSVGPEGENTFKVTFTPKDIKNYEIVTGIEIKIKVNYLNIDTDGDGKADLNVDTNGDGKADLNVDTDGDGKADLNIDTDGDGKANLNVDTNGDGKADLNVDTDGDGKADLNVDTDGDGKADLNVDVDGDGKADLNIDTDGDGKPDKNLTKDENKSDDPTNNEDSDIKYSDEDYSGSNTYAKGNLRIYSEKYIFGNKYMEYVNNKTTVQALKSWCVTNGTMEVYDKGGMLKKKDTDYVGTGMILKVSKDEESMSFIIAVQGDISGDGIVTTADAAQVEFHILNKKVLDGEKFRAADINRNKAVTGEDLATIMRKLQYLEPEVINPNYVEVPEENNETNNAENKDTLEDTKVDTSNESENKNNTTKENTSKADESKENTVKENTVKEDTNKIEESKDNTIKEETNKTDITKDNKVNETEEKENNSKEKTNLPENNTVQYKKTEE